MLTYILPIEKKRARLFVALLILMLICIDLSVSARGYKGILYLKDGTIIRSKYMQDMKDGGCRIRQSRHEFLDFADDRIYAIGGYNRHALPAYQYDYKYDPQSKTYVKLPSYLRREHGVFMEWQTCLGTTNGMKIVMGYRINTYVALGLGIGAEYCLSIPNRLYPIQSGYAPCFFYLTGDFMKSKITPFYSLEVGYALPMYPHLQSPTYDASVTSPPTYYDNYGGLTAGLGFGVRFYTRNNSNVTLSLITNSGFLKIKTSGFAGYATTAPYYPTYATYTSYYATTQPLSIRFGLGF